MSAAVPSWLVALSARKEPMKDCLARPADSEIWQALASNLAFQEWAIERAKKVLAQDKATGLWTGSGKEPISRKEFFRRRKAGCAAYWAKRREDALAGIDAMHMEHGELTAATYAAYLNGLEVKPLTLLRHWAWYCEENGCENTFKAIPRKRAA